MHGFFGFPSCDSFNGGRNVPWSSLKVSEKNDVARVFSDHPVNGSDLLEPLLSGLPAFQDNGHTVKNEHDASHEKLQGDAGPQLRNEVQLREGSPAMHEKPGGHS